MSGCIWHGLGDRCVARTFLAPRLGAHGSSPARPCLQLVYASHQMIPEDRVKIVLAAGQPSIWSVLLLARSEGLEARGGERNPARWW